MSSKIFMRDSGLTNNMDDSAFFAGGPSVGMNGTDGISHYSFTSEMDLAVDISTFPAAMAIGWVFHLSMNIWVAQTLEGLSGSFVFGAVSLSLPFGSLFYTSEPM
ncbi:hypothetical protein DEU56DRAFT_907533 [Suillus clintonianus]|uniref:uncharacterized protein n=1 Tax=Suillus clintonianus TaxID=1904413 RepID=UPI001B865AD7|nr:uncharacterized protein DEU56DRAFT_907533 [Suillus clintonianus]KAG2154076.1 hypothetical protein DEU56DRAFT_907533 [Suillus clintonianus]